MRKTAPLLAAILGILVASASGKSSPNDAAKARQKGCADAEENMRNHIYGLQIGGDETGERKLQLEMLSDKSLEMYITPPGMLHRADFMAGYNEAIRRGLTKRYGYDLIERMRQQAETHIRMQKKGSSAATADIRKKKFKFVEIGLPDGWAEKYWKALTDRYGIEIEVRGCVTTEDELSWADGYNLTMVEAVKKKFGNDVIEKTEKEFAPPEAEKSQAHKSGAEAARNDFARGVYKTYGHPDEQQYNEILRSNGIGVEDFDEAAKKLSDDYCFGYDSEMEAQLQQVKGPYFFSRAHHQALREIEEAKAKK